jgi:hypothetical protein
MASTAILTSLRNMTNAKSRIIAINIAREGVEAVRSIRDTNWLRFSDSRRDCWNHMPGTSNCDGSSPILPGTYIVYKHTDESWRLAYADDDTGNDSDSDGDPTNDNINRSPLSLVDVDPNVDSDGEDTDNNSTTDSAEDDRDMYNHTTVSNHYGTEPQTTAFRRVLVVEYLENQPVDTSSPSNSTLPNESINTQAEWTSFGSTEQLNRMRITSTVYWSRGSAEHSAELKTILTDHLGRNNLTN